LSVTDLSRMLDLDPGTLSRLLKRLEAADLVRRDRDPADERSLAVVLSAKGRALRQQALSVPGAILDRLGMDIDELVELHTHLTAVIAAAKQVTADA
jgi:DNA-binding MarR family transcriptional regulator